MQRTMMNTGKRRLVMALGMGFLFLTGVAVAAYQNSALSRGISTVELGIVGEPSEMDTSAWLADDCLETGAPGRTISSTGEVGEVVSSGMIQPGHSADSPDTVRDGDTSAAPVSGSPSSPEDGTRVIVPETPHDGEPAEDTADDDGTEVASPPHDWGTAPTECPAR